MNTRTNQVWRPWCSHEWKGTGEDPSSKLRDNLTTEKYWNQIKNVPLYWENGAKGSYRQSDLYY